LISSTTKKFLGVAVAASMLALAGCGQAPEEAPAGTTSAGATDAPPAASDDFKPCLVSDDGGFNDKSFNQSAKEGIDRAAAELGVTPTEVQSKTANDYAPNLDSLVAEGCTFIVSVGFKLSADTIKSALANPEISYAIIDDWADNTGGKDDDGNDIGDGETDAPNIKPLMFDTVQAAYLGGYVAAAYSAESGVNKVGTVGGIPIPPVTIFMDGFVDGVAKYNEDKSASVETFGWDATAQTGSMTGGFAADDAAKQAMVSIIDQGVDVLLPVGGPIYQSGAAAIDDSGRDIALLGVDADLTQTDPSVADKVLVSVLKRIDQAVYDATMQAAGGEFDTTAYVGTLENGGVGLSEIGADFADKLPAGVADEVTALQDAIISGDLTVSSPSSPVAR